MEQDRARSLSHHHSPALLSEPCRQAGREGSKAASLITRDGTDLPVIADAEAVTAAINHQKAAAQQQQHRPPAPHPPPIRRTGRSQPLRGRYAAVTQRTAWAHFYGGLPSHRRRHTIHSRDLWLLRIHSAVDGVRTIGNSVVIFDKMTQLEAVNGAHGVSQWVLPGVPVSEPGL